MARGRELHQLRQKQCNLLGKVLTKRAKSKCELCLQRASLKVVELYPLGEEPTQDWALILCANCQPLVNEDLRIDDTSRLQFLHESIWSDILPVQISSIRLVKHLIQEQIPWAQGMLDSLYIPPEVESKL